MVDERAIHPVELPGEPPRYELREAAEHHHHFRCRTCAAVFNLDGCVEGLKGMLPEGFRMTGHDIVIYGYCEACNT
jgi:Fur family ferric uptake transcriptional regulator